MTPKRFAHRDCGHADVKSNLQMMQPIVMDIGTDQQASGSGLDKVASCSLLCPDTLINTVVLLVSCSATALMVPSLPYTSLALMCLCWHEAHGLWAVPSRSHCAMLLGLSARTP